ncbi:MAG: hypothetical protein RJA49_1780 [Actinomycetota bacterium]
MAPQPAIPTDPTAVDAAWMHDALTAAGVARGATVTDVAFAGYIGTGQMGRNARYALTWDRPDGRPASVVGKFPTDDPTGRASGFDNGSYRTEWTFYQELAHTVNVRAPQCHVALFDEDEQNFVLLMEDLAGSAQGDQMRGLTVDEALLAVEQAVAFHAPRWGDPTLAELMTRSEDEAVALLHAIYDATHEATLARLGPNLDDEAIDLVRRFAPKVGAWVTASDAPRTLLHMDFRPDNFLFGVAPDAPPLVVVDWQTVTVGPGTHDLAYMIGGSFEPEQRALVERGLVEQYCAQLAAHGIDYPFDNCWKDYRISSLWGVLMSVIATMLAAQTERGDLMLTTMLRRHARQAIELDALSLVG